MVYRRSDHVAIDDPPLRTRSTLGVIVAPPAELGL